MVAHMVKNLPAIQETWVWSLGREDPLKTGMATHSSILAWRIPWTEEAGGLQSLGLQSQTRQRLTHAETQPQITKEVEFRSEKAVGKRLRKLGQEEYFSENLGWWGWGWGCSPTHCNFSFRILTVTSPPSPLSALCSFMLWMTVLWMSLKSKGQAENRKV